MNISNTRYGLMKLLISDTVISKSLELYGEWAQDELNLLHQFIKPGMNVLDIGAFIGTHSLAFANFVGQGGSVYAFEPRHQIFNLLVENTLSVNKIVTPFNFGIGEDNAKIDVNPVELRDQINFGSLSINNSDLPLLGTMVDHVQVKKIDGLITKNIDFIKIDVEGMELQVLRGARELILRDQPIIFCECNTVEIGYKILNFSKSHGYKVYGHLASAFNSDNFNSEKTNIFGLAKEVGLLLIPHSKLKILDPILEQFKLASIEDINDLVLLLLHKPQYVTEELIGTNTSKEFGIEFPSPLSSKLNLVIERTQENLERTQENNWRIKDLLENLKPREAELHHEIHSAHILLGEAYLEISRLRNTLSWKITRPLRIFGFLKKKIKTFFFIDRIKELQQSLRAANHKFPSSQLLRTFLFGKTGDYEACLKYYEDLQKIILALKNRGLSGEVRFLSVADLSSISMLGVDAGTTIIFDHNGGGGSNFYSRELIKDELKELKTVYRIYFFEKFYFLELHSFDTDFIFYTDSIVQLFEMLDHLCVGKIIVNSVYGNPDIDTLISSLISLKNTKNIFLDVKVHDFLALCPSPHLMNLRDVYCLVPNDLNICTECLKSNNNWYHSWYPEEKKPADISSWRNSFNNLLKIANRINFFDQSSIEILSRGLDFDLDKVDVTPHQISHLVYQKPIEISGPLHIGILGTLSLAKGLEIIRMLEEYIDRKNICVRISVIGNVTSTLPDSINIYGEYERQNLPNIVKELGVNIIFMASIVPETFSYTLSEAIQMKLPVLSFDVGAQGSRVGKYQFGAVIPLGSSSELILGALQTLHDIHSKKDFA